jgi:choline dehydrogenase-like flavoprotein
VFEDGREIAGGSVLRADLCIVGAGAAGITIARALAGTAISVIVIESGGFESDVDTQALYNGSNVGTTMNSSHGPLALQDLRLRYLGGTTNHWAGWCRPLEPVDFGPTPARPDAAWPFGRETLDPWYELAGAICQIGDFQYESEYWQRAVGISAPLVDTEVVTTRVIQIAFPLRFGEQYRSDLVRARNVRVLLQSNVARLAAAPNGQHVTTAQVATLDGPTWEVEARAFVLATGGIEVPRLLLASNDVRPAGLGNDQDLVGRYFMEHIDVPGGIAILNQPHDAMTLYLGKSQPVPPGRDPDREFGVKGAFVLNETALRRHELLGIEATLGPEPIGHVPLQVDGITSADVAELYARLTGYAPATIAYFRLLGEQAPNPESRVKLVRERDALGMPRVELAWRPTQRDRQSMRRGLALLADELARAGVGRMQVGVGGIVLDSEALTEESVIRAFSVTPNDFDTLDFPLEVGFHHMGTARMADSEQRGVVDANCRVHSIDNLYIAGSAVFPTSGTSTPTFTIVALALRLADHLQREVLA